MWYIILSFVSGTFIYVIFQSFYKQRELLKKLKESEKSYQDLVKICESVETVKQDLEQRIQEEVAKNREKDYVLIQQSKIDETDNEISAEFIDNAGGIELSLLEKIFEPYFTTRHHGTGLGLYMAKKILENMDGSVLAENTGDGTRFCLTVPKVAAAVKPKLLSS